MSSYFMGYHYDRVTRGKGCRVTASGGRMELEFNHVTQKSARELKAELERWGHKVTIEKEEYNV